MNAWTIVVLVLAVAFVFWKIRLGFRSPAELRRIAEALSHGARLIDVRSPSEFEASHLSRAINVPVTALLSNTKALGNRTGVLVVYCASGARSAHAARSLRGAGFEHVLDLGPMHNGNRLPSIVS